MADGDVIPSEFVGGSQEFAKTTKALEVENMKTDLLSRDAVVVKGVADAVVVKGVTDAVVVKGVAAAVVGKSHVEVASVSAIPGSSSAADEFDSESTERGGKDSLKTQEVVLMVDEFQALQDEIADITLKLEVAQRENELMRLELGREKADLIRQLSDSVLNEQLDKENKDKLEMAKYGGGVLLDEPGLLVAAERVGEMADGDVIPSFFVGGS